MWLGSQLPTHHDQILRLHDKYVQLIEAGTYKPYVYPLTSVGPLLVIIWFLVPHGRSTIAQRIGYAVWTINLVFSIYILRHFRARQAPIDYGVGLITWWWVLWTAAVMLFHDGQLEFARIERANGATKTLPECPRNDGVDQAAIANGLTRKPAYVWQSYPYDGFIERLDWIIDLLTNFRGMSWNWRIATLPGPPKNVEEALRHAPDRPTDLPIRSTHSVTSKRKDQLLADAAKRFFLGYLALDFLRTIVIHDPFFQALDWRNSGIEGTPHYLPLSLRQSDIFVQAYRLLMGLFAIYWALATIFTLAPLFFGGLLGEDMIGVRGQPWMYPDEWGSYGAVLDRGLVGFWGTWWHQTFRFAFEAPSKWLLKMYQIDRRSLFGKAVQLFVAFGLSGSLHAAGSYTSIGDTRPLRGPFTFFILQPFGILVQELARSILARLHRLERTPVAIRRAANFMFVHFWLYHTGILLIEDIAKGGTFLYEPVPLSVFRLLGLGGRNEPVIRWGLHWFRWHQADRWWETGLIT